MITPLQIGPHTISGRAVLAPMAGLTDQVFRNICRDFGAAMAVSEMNTADTVLWNTRKSMARLDLSGDNGLRVLQIAGSEPEQMAAAAKAAGDLGADIVDINMGCPAKKVCRVAAGSALLRDEPLVGRILSAVVEAVNVPVTLKIRTGWSPEARNAVAIAHIAWESGIAALAVHGRTRACGYGAPADYETIRSVGERVEIPLIANGDIDSPEKARRVLNYTGAGAIMLGRAAQGRPWIFRDIAAYLASGAMPAEPPIDWIRNLLLEHLDGLYG